MQNKMLHGQWQHVEEELAAEIAAGRFGDDMQLPREAELMERFGVGRHSIRRAMAQLQNRGLVQVEQGKGTFVRGPRLDYRLSERTRFSQNLLEQGREPLGQAIKEEEIAAPRRVSEALRLPPGEPVYHIVRLGLADGEPIDFSNAYYPVRRFPGFDKARRNGRNVSIILAEYGVTDYIRLRTDIIVRLPTREEARRLAQSETQPIVLTKKVDVDMKGTPIAYSETAWASERVQFSIDNTNQLLNVLAQAANAKD
ncbi:phosphonate metabolism transcriptional regulator PhnF [Mesorhizobium sp. VK25A]|uniref:Phosphonate metabolism transcriptional regulator PhnF n=1 Tax=Mesorhizobium vachelliae TaxID=3072309 RepID=A0ABU5A6M2_9HYPH|nr:MULTISPECIES: phosphonate metabolism transcriptional regulator PhnF [unclassified Mesorhizobium]MDX8531898.1 phosphonate metabolism transcriptional regulator PhnF [Mesorhizobium sp. VK25D]MDX8543659.1 phosphonate metabolism transcriptional regulator PhnF [Mesorhizobium sp. VK25A]